MFIRGVVCHELLNVMTVYFLAFQVERRHCSTLDAKQFFFEYCMTGSPVIITGLVKNLTTVPWDFQHIKEVKIIQSQNTNSQYCFSYSGSCSGVANFFIQKR